MPDELPSRRAEGLEREGALSDAASPPARTGEVAAVVVELGKTFLLLLICAGAPPVAARLSPWLGMLISGASLWAWARWGPRPFPGLLPGCVALVGVAAIVGGFVVCLIRVVR